MRKKLILSLLAVGALGCGNGRYQIVATAQDRSCHAYRLDTRTGEVLCIVAIKATPVEPLESSPTK
jgi:hypothetical protein